MGPNTGLMASDAVVEKVESLAALQTALIIKFGVKLITHRRLQSPDVSMRHVVSARAQDGTSVGMNDITLDKLMLRSKIVPKR